MDPEVVRHETIGGLIRGILTDIKTLIREEIALARVEMAIAVLLALVGFVSLSSGRRQLRTFHAVPPETVTTLKENSEWIAKRLSSAQK